MVFTRSFDEQMQVLAVELKDVARRITPSVLGKSKMGDLGGSIERLGRSSLRFYNSSNGQLKQMCQTVQDAYLKGTLKNALFTSGADVNKKAQEVFNGVYRMVDGQVETVKTSTEIKKPGILEQVSASASAGLSAAKTAATQLTTNLASTEFVVPLFYLPAFLVDPMRNPAFPGYYEPVDG